jgi:flagellar assembly protein FliH
VAAIRKFTFDNDFDRPARPAAAKPEVVAEPPPPPPPSFSEAELAEAVAAARKAALAEGVAQGRAETITDTERRVAAGLNAIGSHLGVIDSQVRAVADGLAQNTVALSLAIARQLFPALLRRGGAGEIEALLVQCLETLRAEPWFTIRVPAEQVDALTERVQAVAAERGYQGRLTVVGDADLKLGDCRIEWAQGGMIRDREQIWAAIEAAIEQALASTGNGETAEGRTA